MIQNSTLRKENKGISRFFLEEDCYWLSAIGNQFSDIGYRSLVFLLV